MKKSVFLLISIVFVTTNSLHSQNITGKWATIDDNTGKKRSIVEVYKKGGKYFGKVVDMYLEPHEDPDPVCDLCSDNRKDQKIRGMEIIQNMEQTGNEYTGGEILDPENGKVYRCKLWVEDGKLMVRGYIAFFFRTQEWLRHVPR